MLLAEVEIFFRIEGGGPFDPGMNRVRRDDVEFFSRGQDVMPGVIVDDFNARIMDDVIILLNEVRGHHTRHQRLDLADDDSFNPRIGHEGAGRHSRPAAYH